MTWGMDEGPEESKGAKVEERRKHPFNLMHPGMSYSSNISRALPASQTRSTLISEKETKSSPSASSSTKGAAWVL